VAGHNSLVVLAVPLGCIDHQGSLLGHPIESGQTCLFVADWEIVADLVAQLLADGMVADTAEAAEAAGIVVVAGVVEIGAELVGKGTKALGLDLQGSALG
jgi:hypothetical protein